MKITFDELKDLTLTAAKEGFVMDDSEIYSIFEVPGIGDPMFDGDAEIEIDIDPCFMYEYYKGLHLLVTVSVKDSEATAHICIGYGCKDPELANEFIDRYATASRYREIWQSTDECEKERGLLLTTRFDFSSEDELLEGLTERFALFRNDRFTNELRPFIHYFD